MNLAKPQTFRLILCLNCLHTIVHNENPTQEDVYTFGSPIQAYTIPLHCHPSNWTSILESKSLSLSK